MQTTKERDGSRIKEVTDTDAKTIETCSVGDSWRQGDLEIRFIGTAEPEGLKQVKVPSQLAPGETKGSRHILVAEGVKAFELTRKQPLEGPVLSCPIGLTIEHPEHGDITMKEPGWYAITYQRAYADELRRQAD